MIDFYQLATQCAPNVAVGTLRALADVESSFNPYAIGVVQGRLVRQPRNLLEGISTVKQLQAKGMRFSAGLIQINSENWRAYGLNHERVFQPCANMRAAQGILTSCYTRATKTSDVPQVALRKAISCYYSNNFVTGFKHGYVQKVVARANAFRSIPLKPQAGESNRLTPVTTAMWY